MDNLTGSPLSSDLPPLPKYHLTPLPALVPPIPDKLLILLLPIVVYWAFSMLFHWIDMMDFFPQYRLHTPAEVLKRNRASRWEVVRDVIVQQVVQTIVGLLVAMTEPDEFVGKEQYDIAVWAQRIRMVERVIPGLLAFVGVDSIGLGKNLSPNYPTLAAVVLGGHYSSAVVDTQDFNSQEIAGLGFARWEIFMAWSLYHILVPALQFLVGICIVDTWQYFLHRWMHMNKWMYTTFHSRHHRLYVPYAYGALYNHPFEGFLLDTLGAGIAFKIAGMSTRQGMCFFVGSTMKTVDDHCGYALPFDPFQRLTSNNAGYHDVHHQSWGIKTNFSQPFFTFWDRWLGTVWTGGDVSARYERSRLAAQKALDEDNARPITGSRSSESLSRPVEPYQNDIKEAKSLTRKQTSILLPEIPPGKAEFQATGSRQQVLDDELAGGRRVLEEETNEEVKAQQSTRRSPRKRALSSKDNFKGLRERVSGSMSCRTGMIGVDGSR